MSDYDNTNRGAFFKPYAEQRFALQGRIDIDGNEGTYVVIHQPVKKGGDPEYVLYKRVGVLFSNAAKKESGDWKESAPDFSGPIDQPPGKKLSAWVNTSDKGVKYLSVSVGEKDNGNGQSPSQRARKDAIDDMTRDEFIDDDVPF